MIFMKVAIIGTGSIAPVHLHGIFEANGEVVALCDNVPAKARELKNAFNLKAEIYTNYKEMLEKEVLDVVHICTPHYLHQEMIISALNLNINVLAEKPVCINKAELNSIKEALKYSSAELGICLQNRYLPASQTLKHLLKDEKILSGKAKLLWSRDEAYYQTSPWRSKWETAGGGVMINQAIHTLDLLLWFCGMPDKIKGEISNSKLKDLIEVETTAEFTLSGKYQAHFYATTTCSENLPVEIEIVTTKNIYQMIGDDLYINSCLQELPNIGPGYGKPYWGAGHNYLIQDYYQCLQEKRSFPINVFEAEKAMNVIRALYQSKGQEIDL